MESLLDWLSTLPLSALYATMALLAAVENIFPPIPADSIVALGSFLAARGQGSVYAAFACIWAGNIVGAMIMYGAGRRFGPAFLERFMRRAHTSEKHENRLESLYIKYGLAALAVSRFIPGVRAMVPPFAGAMRLPALSVFLVLALPSGIWYGIVTLVAFQMGSNFDLALDNVKQAQTWTTVVAVVIVVALAIAWFVFRKRRKAVE